MKIRIIKIYRTVKFGCSKILNVVSRADFVLIPYILEIRI